MKPLLAALLLAATALPAPAQEDGDSLMGRGLRMFMDGLREEMEPALRDLSGMAQNAAPFLQEMQRNLADVVQEFDAYEAPEIQPNGDILIRRKEPLETSPEDAPALPDTDGPAIDL